MCNVARQFTTRAELERHIRELAAAYGWRHHRARGDGLTSDGFSDGFPPEVLVRDDRLIFVTLTPNGSLTAAERAWINDLETVSDVEVYVITRSDLSALTAILTAVSSRKTSAPAIVGAVQRSLAVLGEVRGRTRAG